MKPPSTAPWLHFLALGTACAALPLLFLGAEVTTKQVGMADQRALVHPVQAIQELSQGDKSLGWKIEHSHRLAGWLVGILGIVLAAAAWITRCRFEVKILATVALVLIGVQGLLGIFRVHLNAIMGQQLAWVHGSFAQVVFAVLAAVALLTSTEWAKQDSPAPRLLRRWALAMVTVVFFQLLLGAIMRHHMQFAVARWHLVGAFVVFAGLLLLCHGVWGEGTAYRRWAWVLLSLLAAQILLGVEAWMSYSVKIVDPSFAIRESVAMHWIRSAHYVIGALIFAATVVLALKAHRGLAWSWSNAPVRNLEAAV